MHAHRSATRIVWYEIAAFAAIIAISWLNESIGFEASLFGGDSVPNWRDPIIETTVTTLIAIPTILLTYRLSKRLHYLEGFLRLCAWCQKVGDRDDWISMEKFVQQTLQTRTTHGICPECSSRMRAQRAK